MSLADELTAAAQRKGGLTVLDLDETVFDTEAAVPEIDFTGTVWPMRDGRGWWFIHGFAGRHRKTKTRRWLAECLTCHREQTIRTGRLLQRRAYCHHGERVITNDNPKENNA